jgi:hypothetical protein
VDQESNLGGGAPVIRGVYGNRILIVIDGVRLRLDDSPRADQSLNTIGPAIVGPSRSITGRVGSGTARTRSVA